MIPPDRPTPRKRSRAQNAKAISGNEEWKPKITAAMIEEGRIAYLNWLHDGEETEALIERILYAALTSQTAGPNR